VKHEIVCALLDQAMGIVRAPGFSIAGCGMREDGGGRSAGICEGEIGLPRRPIHKGEVIEGFSHIRMVRAERFLPDGERALVAVLGLGIFPL
jgi:hypothetical protein